ncbi:hypothetical protein [Hyphomicrobium sp. 99]|nr:hypothetical protein [Hyphomicrobium sp. 99]
MVFYEIDVAFGCTTGGEWPNRDTFKLTSHAVRFGVSYALGK